MKKSLLVIASLFVLSANTFAEIKTVTLDIPKMDCPHPALIQSVPLLIIFHVYVLLQFGGLFLEIYFPPYSYEAFR